MSKRKLETDRLTQRANEHFDTLEAKGGKLFKKQDRNIKSEELESKLGVDAFSREVTAMATPLVYYELAATRLLDNIATHLERRLLWEIEHKVRNILSASLCVTNEAYCRQLLAEDSEREAQRERLLAEKEKLDNALEELRTVQVRSKV